MIKIKLIRVTKPELCGCMHYNGGFYNNYICKVCGDGVEEEYRYCPCCGSELDWRNKKSRKLRKLIDSI